MSPFCGATDTTDSPVLDFWWSLLWVSKPEWVLPYSSLAEAYVLLYMFPEIHLWCDTCRPLGSQHGSRAIFHIPARHWWDSKPGARRSQCEIRLSRLGSAHLMFTLSSDKYQKERRKIRLVFNFAQCKGTLSHNRSVSIILLDDPHNITSRNYTPCWKFSKFWLKLYNHCLWETFFFFYLKNSVRIFCSKFY